MPRRASFLIATTLALGACAGAAGPMRLGDPVAAPGGYVEACAADRRLWLCTGAGS
jgi:hypothetical protein